MTRSPWSLAVAFLAGAISFSLQSAAADARDDSAAEKLGWHLATKAYTFRAITLFETIDISRELGVKYFEVNPKQILSKDHPVPNGETLPPELLEELKKKFAEAGVQPVSYGVVNLTKDEAVDRPIFEYAKALGIHTLVSEPLDDAFDVLERLCQEYGIRIAIHNHPVPSRYANPETELKVFASHGAAIGSCCDVGHWTRSGLNAVECLHRLQGHVIQLHFKDVAADKKDVPWGTGETDVKGMLEELRRQKFQGVFSMEYEGADPAHLQDDLRKSIVYFDTEARRILTEGGK